MIKEYQKLLHNFVYLPKPNLNPTFMELCHLGGDRFEERCSAVLQFYFSPLAPHKLRGLFLDSLLELLNIDHKYIIQNVRVITEETTEERKRIDMTIIADDFVIAIENKIFANVYNPLELYRSYIEKEYQSKRHKYFVVLSVKKILNSDELQKMGDNGFQYVSYEDLFRVVKGNLGKYLMECDQNYLLFLFDFIRTIEKKYTNNNMELKDFFFNNRKTVDELVAQYNAFKEEIFSNQCETISQIKRLITDKTNANWRIWQGWDLYISFNDQTNRIGIECWFEDETKENPIGDFHIYITVWKREHFQPYQAELVNLYGDNISYEQNRVYLHLPTIDGPIDAKKMDEIISRLAAYSSKLKDITNRIH